MMVSLQALLDLGDRFSPSVLRQYFSIHGFTAPQPDSAPAVRSALFVVEDLSFKDPDIAALRSVRRVLMFNMPSFWIGAVLSATFFAAQPDTWTLVLDPIMQRTALAVDAVPSVTTTAVVAYTLITSVGIEVWVLRLLLGGWREFFSLFKNNFSHSLSFISGTLARSAVLLDLLSLVVVWHCSSALVFIGSFSWIFGLGILFLYTQIRAWWSLTCNRSNFTLALPGTWFSLTVLNECPPPLTANTAEIQPDQESIVKAISVPTMFGALSRLGNAAISFDFHCVYNVVLKRFATVPMQPDLVLAAAVKCYASSLAYHFPLLPVKLFLILDYGPNPIVLASFWLSLISSVLATIVQVLPSWTTAYFRPTRPSDEEDDDFDPDSIFRP